MAAKALEASQTNFMTLANETFEKHKQAAQGGVKEVLHAGAGAAGEAGAERRGAREGAAAG